MTRYMVTTQAIANLPWPDRVREELVPFIETAAIRLKNEAQARADVREARESYERERAEASRKHAQGMAAEWPDPPTIHASDGWRAWERQSLEIGGYFWTHRQRLYDEARTPILEVIRAAQTRTRAALAGSAVSPADLPPFDELHRELFVARFCSQLTRQRNRTEFDTVGGLEVETLDLDWLATAVAGLWPMPPMPARGDIDA